MKGSRHRHECYEEWYLKDKERKLPLKVFTKGYFVDNREVLGKKIMIETNEKDATLIQM